MLLLVDGAAVGPREASATAPSPPTRLHADEYSNLAPIGVVGCGFGIRHTRCEIHRAAGAAMQIFFVSLLLAVTNY